MPVSFIPCNPPSPENLFRNEDFAAQRTFFDARPALQATPLHSLSGLARELGLGGLYVKDETARFGLNAFKTAGATFAVSTLLERGDVREDDTLVCASEGNHGRAVARAARDAGCAARVYMAASVATARADAIAAEGAAVVRVDGTYDEAVRRMASDASSNGWTIISDTSWPGYEEIPRLIVLGYTRLLDEAEADWGSDPPHAIFVQGGVGGLLAAVACWCDWRYAAGDQRSAIGDRPSAIGDRHRGRPAVVCVEPVSANCLMASAQRGAPTSVPGPFDTVMTGLRCGEMSPSMFGVVRSMVDGFVGIEDTWTFEAMKRLNTPVAPDIGINAGAAGAAGLAGLLATIRAPELADLRRTVLAGGDARVLVIATEGG